MSAKKPSIHCVEAEELERERVILLQKQLEQEKEKNYQTVTTVLREIVTTIAG